MSKKLDLNFCLMITRVKFCQPTASAVLTLDVDFSFVFSGGLSLQGNPWLCTCDNTWLGTWLRRWMRETLQLHASIIGKEGTLDQISSQFWNYFLITLYPSIINFKRHLKNLSHWLFFRDGTVIEIDVYVSENILRQYKSTHYFTLFLVETIAIKPWREQ